MEKFFAKFLSSKKYVAVLVGIVTAAIIGFIISGITNLIFYYSM